MKRIKNNKISIVVLLVLLISIGFAYLSSTLNITGLTRVMGNNWNIYFDNIQYIRGQDFEITAPTTSGTTTTSVSYEVFLPSPGDVYKFNIDIVNSGSLDAMVKVVTDTELTAAQKKYASYYVTYNDGISCDDYQLLPKNSTDTLSVMVAYNKDILEEDLPDTDKSITVTFHLEFEQATSKATARNHITVANRANNNTLSVGDEIAIGSEHFYILETNPESYKLLSKYNLNVGEYLASGTVGKQNSKCGAGIGNATYKCSVKYSTNNYWKDANNNLKNEYGLVWNDNNIYDENFSAETGDNYSVAYYVKNYSSELKNSGMKVINSRLLTYNDAVKAGCTYDSSAKAGTCENVDTKYSFLYSTRYWLGSASAYNTVMRIIETMQFGYYQTYGNSTCFGVRPLIEIPPLDI